MRNPYGASPVAALFQALWAGFLSTAAFTPSAQTGCTIVASGTPRSGQNATGLLLLTLDVQAGVPGFPAANGSQQGGVNDNTFLLQIRQNNAASATGSKQIQLTYGPNAAGWGTGTTSGGAPTGVALLGNQIGIDFNGNTPPASGHGLCLTGIVWNCWDGGPSNFSNATP
jgi:hypothetical protein